MIVEPARRDEFLALLQENYGSAMSPAEFDWWFDGNPAGPRVLNEARDDDGTALGVLAMSCFRMNHGLAAYAVHAVTTSAARGRGVFSTLELHNEQQAADAGAPWAFGFTNPMAGPILVGKLGWEDLTSLRIWVRPKRVRRNGHGDLRVAPGVGPFGEQHAASHAAHHIIARRRVPDLAVRGLAAAVRPLRDRRRLGSGDARSLAWVLVCGDLRDAVGDGGISSAAVSAPSMPISRSRW